MDNLALVKRALTHFDKKWEEQQRGISDAPIDYRPWFDSLADDIEFEVPCATKPPEEDYLRGAYIGRVHRGKHNVINIFKTADVERVANWEIERPLEYFVNGDRVVALGAERWAIKETGADVPFIQFAMVFDCRNGEIVRYVHIMDCSKYVPVWEATRSA